MLNGKKWAICLSLAGGLALVGAVAAGAQNQTAANPAASDSFSIIGDCVALPGQDTITAQNLKRFLSGYEDIARAMVEEPLRAEAKLRSYGFDRDEFLQMKAKLSQGSNIAHLLENGQVVADSVRKGLTECEIELIRANLALINKELNKNFAS